MKCLNLKLPSLRKLNAIRGDNNELLSQDHFSETEKENAITEIVTFKDITCAAFLIREHIVRTPISKYNLSDEFNTEVYLKKEYMQATGSFKERGACYALMTLTPEQKKQGVVTASLGNHSQGLSYHARRLQVPCVVVMPEFAPLVKMESCRKFGAKVIVHGENMTEAKTYAMQYAKEHGVVYINGYDDPAVITGQGTIGLEIIEDLPNIDVIIIPVGGGGLLAGVSLAVKTLNKNIKIIGVESEKCPSFTKAFEVGKPIVIEMETSLADGLAVAEVGANAFSIAAPLVDKMITLKEEWIALTMLRLLEQQKCVVEGGGAIGLAAVLSGSVREFSGKRIAVILSGGNIDSNLLGRCIERSLVLDGRLLKFSAIISDRPGGASEICQLLATLGASIKHIDHERAWLSSDVFNVIVTIVCETRDHQHVEDVKNTLEKRYSNAVIFADNVTLKLNL